MSGGMRYRPRPVRLIVAVGITGLILGYRLFASGVQTRPCDAGSTIESSVAGARFTVKNAAPDTAFALFGAMLIIVMLRAGPRQPSKPSTNTG